MTQIGTEQQRTEPGPGSLVAGRKAPATGRTDVACRILPVSDLPGLDNHSDVARAAWPTGYQAQAYTGSQNLFTLGRAAIYPTGSWEITGSQENADFELGAFAPPKEDADSACHLSDHTDIGIGMNAGTEPPRR